MPVDPRSSAFNTGALGRDAENYFQTAENLRLSRSTAARRVGQSLQYQLVSFLGENASVGHQLEEPESSDRDVSDLLATEDFRIGWI